tara:strand:+ start:455 stop:721 length:267 start_codon:yes stop_codon:yes gene_type:complete
MPLLNGTSCRYVEINTNEVFVFIESFSQNFLIDEFVNDIILDKELTNSEKIWIHDMDQSDKSKFVSEYFDCVHIVDFQDVTSIYSVSW